MSVKAVDQFRLENDGMGLTDLRPFYDRKILVDVPIISDFASNPWKIAKRIGSTRVDQRAKIRIDECAAVKVSGYQCTCNRVPRRAEGAVGVLRATGTATF
jgi:hypothetical protein